MAAQKAIVVQGKDRACLVSDRPIPTLRPDTILVKAVCVALNPHDWKAVDQLDLDGCVVGCDFSGAVEDVSRGPVTRQFAVDDHVMGTVHGILGSTDDIEANLTRPYDGAFQEYVVARTGLCTKIPENLSFEDAATPNVALATCALALYQILQLPALGSSPQVSVPILIYGGSTATGTVAIQCAKISGLTVLTTCSPRNFDLVRSRGADHIFDYSDRDSVSKIKQLTNNDLAYIFDCVGEGSAPNFCYEAMGRKGGKYATVAPPQPSSRTDIEVRKVTGPTCYGEEYEPKAPDLNMKVPARPEDYALCAQVYETTEKLLAAGKLKTHPADVRDGGLRGVPEGLRDMKEGKISGRKLVYKISSRCGCSKHQTAYMRQTAS